MEPTPTWKSPRKIAEEEAAYRLQRFEYYMDQSDQGKLPRAIAITALREELGNLGDLSTGADAEPIA